MYKQLSILLIFILLTGCQKNKSLSFSNKEYTLQSGKNCEDLCTTISIKTLVFEGNDAFTDTINSDLLQLHAQILGVGEQPSAKSYAEIMKNFIQGYQEVTDEFPDYNIPWEANASTQVYFQNPKLLNIAIEYYSFTGGAHGYGGRVSTLYDLISKKPIEFYDLIEDRDGFKAFAEKQFRIANNIPDKSNINQTGFMFEKEQFQLAQNVFIEADGITLYYNAYEIAAYAMGAQQLFLKKEDIIPYLKDNFYKN